MDNKKKHMSRAMLEDMFCDVSLCICMNKHAVFLCSSNLGD